MVKSAKRRKLRAAKRPAAAKASKPARKKAKAARSKGPTPKPVVIDVHAHVLVPEVVKRTYDQSQYSRAVAGPGGVPEPLYKRMTEVTAAAQGDGRDRRRHPGDQPQHHAAMHLWDGGRTTPSPWIVSATIASPKRWRSIRTGWSGSARCRCHEVALAAAELERCVRDLGLRGVIISSHVNGVELGDERLRPFWAKAEQVGAVIFIHPAGSTEQRMLRNRLMITVGSRWKRPMRSRR
jgi:Predicted metal-dependent hydrolase of the TIM-barrel fold